jgi:hypothetical protein
MTQTPFMKSLIVNLQEVNTHSDALIPMEMDGMEDMYTWIINYTVMTSLVRLENLLVL